MLRGTAKVMTDFSGMDAESMFGATEAPKAVSWPEQEVLVQKILLENRRLKVALRVLEGELELLRKRHP
jgi:hypothetical protein